MRFKRWLDDYGVALLAALVTIGILFGTYYTYQSQTRYNEWCASQGGVAEHDDEGSECELPGGREITEDGLIVEDD